MRKQTGIAVGVVGCFAVVGGTVAVYRLSHPESAPPQAVAQRQTPLRPEQPPSAAPSVSQNDPAEPPAAASPVAPADITPPNPIPPQPAEHPTAQGPPAASGLAAARPAAGAAAPAPAPPGASPRPAPPQARPNVAGPEPQVPAQPGVGQGDPIVPLPMARSALSLVGDDPEAERVWTQAINDPNLPANARKDLIEDLNEDGFEDLKHLSTDDLPLIQSRIELIEAMVDDALDDVNAAAFAEAYKDLLNMRRKVTGM